MDAANGVTVGLAFLAGFLSFISPCVLPLVPTYVGYLGARTTKQVSLELAAVGAGGAGQSAMLAQKNRLSVLLHGVFFVGGFTIIFVLFGLLGSAALQLLRGSDYDKIAGTLVIFFGLHVMGVWGWLLRMLITRVDWNSFGRVGRSICHGLERIQGILYSDTRRQMNPRNAYGYAGSSLLGMLFAAGWTPCIGPIFGSILMLVANGHSMGLAAVLLLSYSLGLGIPFLLTAVALDQARGLMKRLQRHMRLIEVTSGAFLIILGYLVFSGQMRSLAQVGSGGFADFSANLEPCVTGVLQGQFGVGDFGTCLNLGPNFKYRTGDAQPAPVSPGLLILLPNGRTLYAR
jgi:cytochrome c-type biogenesis protein